MKMELPLYALTIVLGMGLAGCDQAVSRSDTSQMNTDTVVSNSGEPCGTLTGNAKDICDKEADGRKWVEAAELAARNEPSAQHTYELAIAKADAEIGVAKERCDDLSGNPEDVCRQDAERAFEIKKADATLQMKLSDASATGKEATMEAAEQEADAKKDAREEAADVKQDASLAVAKEQCDRFANQERRDCISTAEANYAKN